MPTGPLAGEIGEGNSRTVALYEGNGTRYDVWTKAGIVQYGLQFAAGFSQARIDDGNAYVKAYTTWTDAVQRVATGDNGNIILGRVLDISRNIPEVATDGGTWTAALATARYGTVEFFVTGQVIRVRADGSGTAIAINDQLKLKAGSLFLMIKEVTNGFLYAKEATTDADAYILAEV